MLSCRSEVIKAGRRRRGDEHPGPEKPSTVTRCHASPVSTSMPTQVTTDTAYPTLQAPVACNLSPTSLAYPKAKCWASSGTTGMKLRLGYGSRPLLDAGKL